MAKTTKAQKSAAAAVDRAAGAAKDAKKLIKTLPKKDAKKLASLLDDAKSAAGASSKRVARKPRAVEKEAVRATSRLQKAAERIESKTAEKADRDAAKAAQKASDKADRTAAKAAKTTAPESTPAAAPASPAPERPRRTRRAAPAPAPTGDIPALTVAQLRSRARAQGLTGYSRLTKAQLVALLGS